jgi:hypothetical protein
VWGHDSDIESRTVDVHIRRLRKAINDGDRADIIRTVRFGGLCAGFGRVGGSAISNGGSVTEYEQMVEMVAKTGEGRMGPRRYPDQQCGHSARQELREDGTRRFRTGR